MDGIADACEITKLVVYRHFESKEHLYRSVLEGVVERMREIFVAGIASEKPSGIGVRAFLLAAREDPDGFVLLWRHACREPEFAEYAANLRTKTVGAVSSMVATYVVDGTLLRWMSETVVGFLVESTLTWLEFGSPDRDGEFIDLTSAALRSMIGSLAGATG